MNENPVSNPDYNVSFRYTKAAGGYEGVITWSSFKSKEAFDKWWAENPGVREKQEIVEQGITSERAIELTRSTPVECYTRSSRQEVANSLGITIEEVDAILG